MARPRESLESRFWKKVYPEPNSGCWLWGGFTDANGYGKIGSGGTGAPQVFAHRVSWAIHAWWPGRGDAVCHRCDNPPCVNPAHLFLGSQADNLRDMWAKERGVVPALRGEDCGHSRLTEDDVREIRMLADEGWSQRALARRFGRSRPCIRSVILRKTWRHVA